MSALRTKSLFWTFAAAFLLVLVTATLLQGLVILAVVEPISARWSTGQARDAAEEIAATIAALPAPDDARIAEALRSPDPGPGAIAVFRFDDGRLVTGHPFGPPWFRPGPDERHRPPPDARPDAVRPGDRPPPEAMPGDRLRPGASPEFRVLAEQRVDWDGTGGVVRVIARRPPRLWPPNTPRPVLFFVPLAIVLSALFGLLLFRAIVRRLRALEALAARVTEGDLDARVHDPGGDEIGRLGRSLNRMTESLSEARRRIERQEEQRRRLVADVTHELATPLTSIRGYAETLLNPDVSVTREERTSYLENVVDESRRMDLLVRDLFELARLEAGAERLETERLDWAALCRGTVERFAARAKEAGVQLEWRGGDGEAWVVADGRRLERLVENLIVNALRYVPAGGRVEVRVVAAEGSTLALDVEDDGPGIPPADLEHVFDRFYQADPSRSSEGSGLGLAIVKEIAERHGGSVRASNREGGGARFRVVLPAA